MGPRGDAIAAVERPGPWGRISDRVEGRHEDGFWLPALWLYPPRWVPEWELEPDELAALSTAWDSVAVSVRPALRCYLDSVVC